MKTRTRIIVRERRIRKRVYYDLDIVLAIIHFYWLAWALGQSHAGGFQRKGRSETPTWLQ